jgi:hypothetical protein
MRSLPHTTNQFTLHTDQIAKFFVQKNGITQSEQDLSASSRSNFEFENIHVDAGN